MESIKEKLEEIRKEALLNIDKIKSFSDWEKVNVNYLGRKHGELNNIVRSVSSLPKEQKPIIGKLANEVKQEIVQSLNSKKNSINHSGQKSNVFFDVTVPGKRPPEGHLHPITKIRMEVEEIFKSMGFEVREGNELTDLYYNFLSLNFPENHPAMDSYDTFYIKDPLQKKEPELKDKKVMRAHTSNMQVKIMENKKPPLRVIVPGRCFRNEATDASHEHTFYQMEGFMVDENISIANLIYTQKTLLSKVFGKEVKVRLRPGYFPFVEPGFELDSSCVFCNGKGCRVCKQTGWIELIPCGMIHPGVFKSAGYPEGKYTGFAFGMGFNRLVMLKYGITDIRHFMAGDLRFINQF